jgi:glycosyltransferase involved in cell wall biosynthesis
MKICILRHAQFPDCARVRKEVLALLGAGHQVDVLCLAGKGRPAFDRFREARIFRIPVRHKRGTVPRYLFEYGASFLAMSIAVSCLFLKNRYQVVQVNTMPDFLVFAAWLPKLLGAKVVLDLHEPTPELWQTKRGLERPGLMGNLQARLEQCAIRFADRPMTVTQALRRRYAERGADISRMIVVPNVCSEEFAPAEQPPPRPDDGTFRLITHGLIEHRYGHEVVLRAVRQLAPTMPELRFDIVGDGEYAETVSVLIRDLALQDRVRLHGFLPYKEMMRFLIEADVGVVSMLSSPYSRLIDTTKMYEYMAIGKPVIVPRLPAIEDNFDDSCVAFFEPGNPEDLARRIAELRTDSERRRRMAENVFRRYDGMKWSRSKMAYLNLLEGMLETR